MQTETAPSLARGSLDRMASRLANEKHELVLFLTELADFDRDKLALELGYPSTLGCLRGEFGLTESSACRRISAARLLARFPAIAPYLLAHRLTVTGLIALQEVLDDRNVEPLLERAAGLSEPAVRELVMQIRMDAARLAPVPQPAAVATEVAATTEVPPEDVSAEDATSTLSPVTVEPSDRTPLTIWMGRELRDELAAARSLLSHAVPSGKTEDLLLYVLRRVRTQHERKKYGGKRNPKPTAATHPAASAAESPPSHARYASARVRRTTGQREGRSCGFVGAEGRRCGSTWQLEFQHIEPAARGGQPTEANTTLFCRLHNRLQAERDFGKQHVADRIAEAQARRSEPPAAPAAPSSPYVPDAVSALVHLGFKRKQAEEAVRIAVAKVPPDCDIQTLLREALRILVPSRSAVP